MRVREVEKVAKAVREDIESVLKIAEECGLAPWSKNDCLLELERGDSIFLIARTQKSQALGFILGRVLPGQVAGSFIAEIYNLGVSPNFRRCGIGSLLLTEFFALAESLGVTKVFLEVRSMNFDAIEFYKKQGFEAYSARPSFYKDPPDAATLMHALVRQFRAKMTKQVA